MLSATLVLLAAAASTLDAAAARPLDEITVEAAKRPVSTLDLANRVTLIDEARLDRELAQNIQDLVRYEPGVDVVDQGSRFGLSGISIRGIGGNRVQIEVDGVSTSGAFSIGSFSNASRDFVDVESLKQVEIVRGPASAMFGSDALGGVVSFVTKSPQDVLGERSRHLDFSAGFNGVDSSALLAGTAALRRGAVSAMLRVNLREGAERDIAAADPLDDQSVNVLAKLGFGNTNDGGFGVTLERFEADSLTEVDSLEHVQNFSASFGFPYVVDTTEVSGDDRRTRSRVSVGQEWLAGLAGTNYLRWRAYYQDSETVQRTREVRDTLIAGAPGSVERDRRFAFEQDLYGIEINAGSDFELGPTNHELAYGFEYEVADTAQIREGVETNLLTGGVSNTVGPDVFPVRDFPPSITKRTGVYLQDRISIGRLSLIPGVRWDRYELNPEPDAVFAAGNPGIDPVEFDDGRVSPKLGAVWRLSETWHLFAQYSEGFRAPPVNDVNVGFTNLQFGYTTLPNPDLESESSRGIEVGVRMSGENASFEASTYVTRYDDFIESFQVVGFDPVNQLLLFQSLNVDEAEIEGAELSAAATIPFMPDGWKVNVAAAYADGRDRTTGVPINSIAPLNGVAGLSFTQPAGLWGASLLVRGAALQDDLDEADGPLLSPSGYVVVDTNAYWRPTEAMRLRAGVYNLFDRDYTAYLDVQGVPQSTLNPDRFRRPGRHFSVAIDYTF